MQVPVTPEESAAWYALFGETDPKDLACFTTEDQSIRQASSGFAIVTPAGAFRKGAALTLGKFLVQSGKEIAVNLAIGVAAETLAEKFGPAGAVGAPALGIVVAAVTRKAISSPTFRKAVREFLKDESGSVRLPGQNSAPQAITNPGIQWGKGIHAQGMPWEDHLAKQMPAGSRLPPGFKAFDFFDRASGVATSAKTLDTTTPTKIADPKQVYSSLVGNIDDAADFTRYTLQGRTLNASQITARELQVAVPKGTTPAQWEQISKAIQYGQGRGVTVRITVIE